MCVVETVLGALAVVTSLLPWSDAVDVTTRVAPVLLFLVLVTVLAELADEAEVFDVAATRAARLAGGRTRRLYLLVFALGTVTTIVPALLLGVPVAAAATTSALVVVVAFVVRRRTALHWGLVPWRLVLLVEGLFLVVSAIGPHGLDTTLHDVAGSTSGLRIAGTAALGANLVNNLPAYLALERTVPPHHLLDVLLGVNLGPLILPWGSLATLLWLERCRARDVHISAKRFALAGLALVPILLLTTVPL